VKTVRASCVCAGQAWSTNRAWKTSWIPGTPGLPRVHPLRRPLHDVKNAQDPRRGAGFDEPDGIEDGSPPMLNELAALVAFAFIGPSVTRPSGLVRENSD